MICLLLIMTMFFINGIENAEQKPKQSGTALREEEMNAKTKAWLLMVESGKVDEEELRRITPKSIFIAPLLTSGSGKCKEGYRHDHLGQCVKVIKIDPKVQLELLLKRLNLLYNEKKQEEEGLAEVSSGPLHFSIPISNEKDREVKPEETRPELQPVVANATEVQSSPELIPIPLPMILYNQTSHTNQSNHTKEIESSGMEPLNDTDQYATLQVEGSGFASGDAPAEQENTSSVSLLSEEADYLDIGETESTTEVQSTTEISTEMSTTTTAPVEDTNLTESYQSYSDESSVNDSVVNLPNENVQNPEVVSKNSESDIIHFPTDETRTHVWPTVDSGRIRFPDDPRPQGEHSYQSPQSFPNWNPQYQIHPSAIPRHQFWWLPENWKVDENQQKSTLVKVWSRLPLIHDITIFDENEKGFKKSFPSSPPQPQHVNTLRRNHEFSASYNNRPLTFRRGQPFTSTRFQEAVPTPRTAFRIQR